MTEVIFFITLISLFIYIFGLFSLFVKERLFLSESLLATCYGIIIRKMISPLLSPHFMNELARIVISLQVVAVGITVPNIYIIREWPSLFILLVPVMLLSYIASSLIINWISDFDLVTSFIIGACVTPTDPVLATAILKGKFADKYIPSHLRNLLTVESGANDALGYILLTIPFLAKNLSFSTWIYRTWIKDVSLSILLGAIIGYSARKVFNFCNKQKFIDKESHLVSMIALGLFATGVSCLLGSDDILSCFVCGIFFSWDSEYRKEVAESHFLDVLDHLFNNLFFICFGATLSPEILQWKYFAIALLILFFRRLPFFYLFKRFISQLKNNREVFFAGWFGPIGVGAIFFAHHAEKELFSVEMTKQLNISPLIQSIVLSSIFIHGLTAPIIHFHLKKRDMVDECESTYSNVSNEI